MDFEGFFSKGFELAKSEPLIAIAVVVVVAVLFYFKTKAMLKLVAAILILACLVYLVTLFYGITSTGLSHKQEMYEKSQ